MDAPNSRHVEGDYDTLFTKLLYISREKADHSIINEEDSRSIISKIVYPMLKGKRYYDYHENFHEYECREMYFRGGFCPMCGCCIVEFMCKRHESNLDWSLEFVKNRLDSDEDCNRAMVLLCFLLVIARDRQRWNLINDWMAQLLNHPRSDMRKCANRIFLLMVKPTARNLKRLTEHFETMIKMFNDPSKDVRIENRRVWKIMSQSRRIGPEGFKLMRTITDLWLLELSNLHDREPIFKALYDYSYLIMPRAKLDGHYIDYHSASNKLYNDFLQIKGRGEELCRKFCDIFPGVASIFVRFIDVDVSLCLIINRFYWLALRDWSDNRPSWKAIMIYGLYGNTPRLSRVQYQEFWKFMMEMYDDDTIHTNDNILDLLKTMSRCILMPEILRSVYMKRLSNGHNFLTALSDVTLASNIGDFIYMCHTSYGGEGIIPVGIQARRILVVFLCRKLISGMQGTAAYFRYLNLDPLPFIMNLLDELRAAYKTRIAQKFTEADRKKFLLPSCLELALPIPFDDPDSKIYFCEFAFFRDTLDYLQRKQLDLFNKLCSGLSNDDKNQLNYYRYKYNDFHICCSAKSWDGEQFQCIEHKLKKSNSDQGICPILNRKSI